MKAMKRIALIAVLGIAVAVVLGTPGAATAADKASPHLYPPVDRPFPNASGKVSLTKASAGWELAWLDSVSVSGLAPNTSYYMPLIVYDFDNDQWLFTSLQFQTGPRGDWKGRPGWLINTFSLWSGWARFEVYDSSTGTLVLTSRP